METLQAYNINFSTINNHLMGEIKEKMVDIVKVEIRKKNIKTGDLQRQLGKLGVEYPIIKVLNKTINTYTVPFDYYMFLCILCGVDLAMIVTGSNHTHHNIKDRKKLANKEVRRVVYNTSNLFV